MMTGTTTIVIGFCAVGALVWTIAFWSGQRVFKVFVCVSAVLHAGLFAVPLAVPLAATRNAAPADEGELLIPYTIVQGVAETPDNLAAAGGADEPSGAGSGLTDQPISETLDENPIAAESEPAQKPPVGTADADLPRIDDVSWFAFDEHPGAVSYRKELQHIILRHFEVPTELDERGYEGRIKVWLSLGRDGRMHYAFIDETMCSEDESVNRLTEDNIRRIADKFPPFPEGVKDYDVSFYVIVDYRNLRNR
jgi:outer membrane biosynthesis protein TonB